jgi:isoleucyl-tRNA synthetase
MNEVTVIPANMEKPMLNQLATRPYWCISRQRSWGVPIPVFYDSKAKTQKEAIINKYALHTELFLSKFNQ